MTRALTAMVALFYLLIGIGAALLVAGELSHRTVTVQAAGMPAPIWYAEEAVVQLAFLVTAVACLTTGYAFFTMRRWGRPLAMVLNALYLVVQAFVLVAAIRLEGVPTGTVVSVVLLMLLPFAIIVFCLTRPVREMMAR